MTVLLVYSFLPDVPPFPQQVLNPTAYRLEAFATQDEALRKARYVLSHSRVHHLAVWGLEARLGDADVRAWIEQNPDQRLGRASEAEQAPRPPPH